MLPSVLLLATLLPSAGSCKVPLLTRTDSGFAVMIATIEEGRTEVFARRAGARDVLTVLMPLGPGLSGDIVRRNDERALAIRCAGEQVRVSLRKPGGQARDLPPVPVENYTRFTMRLHVTDAEGEGRVFVIQPGAGVSLGEGPVLDMFKGQVPLNAGDVSTTLEVRDAPRHPAHEDR